MVPVERIKLWHTNGQKYHYYLSITLTQSQGLPGTVRHSAQHKGPFTTDVARAALAKSEGSKICCAGRCTLHSALCSRSMCSRCACSLWILQTLYAYNYQLTIVTSCKLVIICIKQAIIWKQTQTNNTPPHPKKEKEKRKSAQLKLWYKYKTFYNIYLIL